MTQNRKYEIGRSASGWGVWDANGVKVKGFGNRDMNRLEALKYMYMLYGWDFNRSKYVKENPWLANMKFDWEA